RLRQRVETLDGDTHLGAVFPVSLETADQNHERRIVGRPLHGDRVDPRAVGREADVERLGRVRGRYANPEHDAAERRTPTRQRTVRHAAAFPDVEHVLPLACCYSSAPINSSIVTNSESTIAAETSTKKSLTSVAGRDNPYVSRNWL